MLLKYKDKEPFLHESCYVASNAVIIGDVTLKKGANVWFHTVIRGDKDEMIIGENSNIQDNCTLHTDPGHKLIIGKNVTIGHNAVIHGAKIEDEVLIGMGAIILNGALIKKHSIIGAGALVKEGTVIAENSLVVGCPGRVIKEVDEQAIKEIQENAEHYTALGKEYKLIDL